MKAILLVLVALGASPAEAVIFGVDDRQEPAAHFRSLARATAVMVSPVFMSRDSSGRFDMDFKPVSDSDSFNVCKEEKFADQPASPVSCTGFLIAPNLLATAGHCALNQGEAVDEVTPHCESFQWLFDFQTDSAGRVQTTGVDPERVVRCKRVVYAVHQYDYDPVTKRHEYKRDFAILELERAVVGREPLELASGELRESLFSMVGHPLGLPAKATAGGTLVDASHPEYFRANLDVMVGNSGSPVFNERHEVVGIAVRGFPSPELVEKGSCARFARCAEDGTSCDMADEVLYPVGAHIQRIRSLFPHLR